jgi:hypothetical protein
MGELAVPAVKYQNILAELANTLFTNHQSMIQSGGFNNTTLVDYNVFCFEVHKIF